MRSAGPRGDPGRRRGDRAIRGPSESPAAPCGRVATLPGAAFRGAAVPGLWAAVPRCCARLGPAPLLRAAAPGALFDSGATGPVRPVLLNGTSAFRAPLLPSALRFPVRCVLSWGFCGGRRSALFSGASLCFEQGRVLSGQSSAALVPAGPVVSSGPFGGCLTSSAGGGGEGASRRQTEIHEHRAQVGLGRHSSTAGRFGLRVPLETSLLCFLGYSRGAQ